MSDWLTVIRTELFWTLHETLTKSRTSFLSVKRIINQDQHSDQETENTLNKMPVEIKDKVIDWILCHWGNIVSVMFEKVTSHLAQEAKCSQLFVTTLYPPPPPPAADPLSKPSTEPRALSTTFFFLQMTMKMFCQLQLTTILPTCLLWKGGSWMSRELLILARLEAQTDPRGSMSTLEKDTLTCFWEPSKTFEGSMNTQRSEKAARKGLRIYIHLPPSPFSPLPKLALLSSMEPSPVGFALQ